MFSATVQSVNGVVSASGVEVMSGLNKRSKVCDADANGRVNPNCLR